ncbi:unnamed protein product [Ilex paraguariensis]|uniref:Uncharacterized protein n=1 Tax=Ilex paraguariensis TaxID=185542 RepID=A0ABC8T6T8_9AQUA
MEVVRLDAGNIIAAVCRDRGMVKGDIDTLGWQQLMVCDPCEYLAHFRQTCVAERASFKLLIFFLFSLISLKDANPNGNKEDQSPPDELLVAVSEGFCTGAACRKQRGLTSPCHHGKQGKDHRCLSDGFL